MIRVTIYAGPAPGDENGPYEASVTRRTVDERDLSEELRRIGLEWRQADYFPNRQTVITLDPIEDRRGDADVRLRIREAADALERTGLL